MSKPVRQKMRIPEQARAFFRNVPESLREVLTAPTMSVSSQLAGQFEYIHLFTTSVSELNEVFPKLKAHLKPVGMLWVSWPKGKRLGTDLSLPKVIEIGYSHGLVESTCLSVDLTWSGLKFTRPKVGKIYNNSYGKLPK